MEISQKSGIESLPKEVLLRIFCCLSLNSLKSCYFVSRKFNNVLRENVHYLPKFSITKCVITNEDEKITIHMEKNSHKAPKRVWTARLLPGDSPMEEELDVAEFYRSKGLKGLKWNAGNKTVDTFVPDVRQALKKHLTFVCQRAFFLILDLSNIDRDLAKLIRQVFKKCNSKAAHLKIIQNEPLQAEHIQLIKELECETLDIRRRRNYSLDLLFEDSTIFKDVWSLKLLNIEQDYESLLEVNDDFLSSILTEDIDLNGRTLLTLDGVRRLISEYLMNRREILSLRFGVRFPDAPQEEISRRNFFQQIFYSWNHDPIFVKTEREFQWEVMRGTEKLLITFDEYQYFLISKLEEIQDVDDYPDSDSNER